MNSVQNNDLREVEEKIGYIFADKSLLSLAFTHASCVRIQKQESNERLEFLGDSVLDYVIGAELYKVFPNMTEGELTQKRAFIVSADTLSKIVDQMEIISYLKTAPGEGRERIIGSENVKCDLFEALLGAIVTDSAFDLTKATRFIKRYLFPLIDRSPIDYKSKTIEFCTQNKVPYSFVCTENKENKAESRFDCTLTINDKTYSTSGRSRKDAEKSAAKLFYTTEISQ